MTIAAFACGLFYGALFLAAYHQREKRRRMDQLFAEIASGATTDESCECAECCDCDTPVAEVDNPVGPYAECQTCGENESCPACHPPFICPVMEPHLLAEASIATSWERAGYWPNGHIEA